jgi:hypothetical protein
MVVLDSQGESDLKDHMDSELFADSKIKVSSFINKSRLKNIED